MRTGIKLCSVVLRCLELISAAVVAGIVGFFIHKVHEYHGDQESRVLYAEATAAIGIIVSLVFLPPFPYAFSVFAVVADGIMFVMWVVAFSLLADLDIQHTCNSSWMRGYWGYYWNGFYGYGYGYGYGYKRDNDEHNHQHHRDRHVDGCSEWEAVLAFSFISFVCFFISMCIGISAWRSRENEPRVVVETSQQKKPSLSLPWSNKEKRTSNETDASSAAV